MRFREQVGTWLTWRGALTGLVLLSQLSAGPSAASDDKQEFFYSAEGGIMGNICRTFFTEAHERNGWQVRTLTAPSKRNLHDANEGIFDGTGCRIKPLQDFYPNLVKVGPPYVSIRSHAYTLDEDLEVDGWDSLRHLRIGIHRGHKYAEKGTTGMNAMRVRDDIQLVKMLHSARIDVAVMIDVDALLAMQEAGLRVRRVDPPIADIPLYFHFHKKNAQYIPQMARTIEEMVSENRIEPITREVLREFLGKAEP